MARTVEAHRLLNAEEEFALGRTIQTSLKRERDLNELLHPDIFLSVADYKSIQQGLLASRYAIHSATETLINHNRSWVAKVADKLSHNQSQFLEYFEYGVEGLSKAALKYDPSRGYRFSTYATWWIRQSIQWNKNKNRDSLDVSIETKRKADLLQVRKDWWVQYQGKPLTDTEFAELAVLTNSEIAVLRNTPQPAISLDKKISANQEIADPKQSAEHQAFSNGLSEQAIKEAFDIANLTPQQRLAVHLTVIEGLGPKEAGIRAPLLMPEFRTIMRGEIRQNESICAQWMYLLKRQGLEKLRSSPEALAMLAECL